MGRGYDWRTGQSIITEAEKVIIRAGRESGMSYLKISKMIKPSRVTISRFCHSEGIAVDVSDAIILSNQIQGLTLLKKLSECQWCGRLYKARSDARLPVCGEQCWGPWQRYISGLPMYCDVNSRPKYSVCIYKGLW